MRMVMSLLGQKFHLQILCATGRESRLAIRISGSQFMLHNVHIKCSQMKMIKVAENQ